MAGLMDKFETCLSAVIESIFPGKQLDFLSKEQLKGSGMVFLGNDTFLSLYTGHGKCLIFSTGSATCKKDA